MGFFNKYPYTDFHELNLDWILAHFKEFIDDINSLETWKSQHEVEYHELKSFQDQILAGDFPPSVVAAFNSWLLKNGPEILAEYLKVAVFFGITMDGYFVAYIPETWNDIQFGTSQYDDWPHGVEYGHLTLTY